MEDKIVEGEIKKKYHKRGSAKISDTEYRCRVCREVKHIFDYMSGFKKKNDYICKLCYRIENKIYRYGKLEHIRRLNREAMRRWVERNPELCRIRSKEYKKRNLEKIGAYNRKYRQENKKAFLAYNTIQKALRKNKIQKLSCEICNNPKVHAHHDDYEKPLEIRWLCPKHHRKLHKFIQ